MVMYCGCGSPVSDYEKEKFGKCTACDIKEKEYLREKALREKQEREEAERQKKQLALKETKDQIVKMISSLQGKTIQDVDVTEWSADDVKSIRVTCTDETYLDIELDERNTSCSCHPEYEYYLDVSVFKGLDSE